MKYFIRQLIEIPANNPNDARKRRLIAVLTLSVALLCVLVIVFSLVEQVLQMPDSTQQEIIGLYGGLAAMLMGALAVYSVNRHISERLAAWLFLFLFMLILPFSDSPIEVAQGRSLFVFFIPIFLSSVLLKPYASFVLAGMSGLVISVLSLSFGGIPNVPAIGGFFVFAVITWMVTRSEENAVRALLTANQNLDQRVAERTQELSEALARERAEFSRSQAILEGITDGVVVFDTQGKAVLVNPAVQLLTGYHPADMIGRPIDELLIESGLTLRDIGALHQFFQNPPEDQDSVKIQIGEKVIAISLSTVKTFGGEEIGKVALLRDFTKEAELERMKSAFVATVSHELRTPLNSILGYNDMLQQGIYGPLNAQQDGVVERIMTNTDRLLTIVNDLLDQAQIEAGKLVIHFRTFDPCELVGEISQPTDRLARSKGLALSYTVDESLPKRLYGDPLRLRQVLINLVSNAIKFTEKGSIEVRIFRYGPEHWAMQVTDTGIGIPAEVQRFIFDPFRQIDMAITRKHGGIGLGLSLVKHLTNIHQGEVKLSSQEGQGTTFTVLIPFMISAKSASAIRQAMND